MQGVMSNADVEKLKRENALLRQQNQQLSNKVVSLEEQLAEIAMSRDQIKAMGSIMALLVTQLPGEMQVAARKELEQVGFEVPVISTHPAPSTSSQVAEKNPKNTQVHAVAPGKLTPGKQNNVTPTTPTRKSVRAGTGQLNSESGPKSTGQVQVSAKGNTGKVNSKNIRIQ